MATFTIAGVPVDSTLVGGGITAISTLIAAVVARERNKAKRLSSSTTAAADNGPNTMFGRYERSMQYTLTILQNENVEIRKSYASEQDENRRLIGMLTDKDTQIAKLSLDLALAQERLRNVSVGRTSDGST